MFQRLINNKPIQNVYKRKFSDKFLSESDRQLKLINQNLENITKEIKDSCNYLSLGITVLAVAVSFKR